MENSNENNSRLNRNKKRKSDKILNWLIGAVVLGIIIVGWGVLSPIYEEQVEEEIPNGEEDIVVQEDEQETDELAGIDGVEDDTPEEEVIEPEEIEVIEHPADSSVAQSIIDPTWEPIGTTQTGEHVSLYDGTSVDWKEKERALLYATGLTEDNVIFKRIQNGGSPQKSIGIVTSLDSTEKYRVYLEWIDGEGWKPTQLDVLNTLDFNN